jgi:hypothetical protein
MALDKKCALTKCFGDVKHELIDKKVFHLRVVNGELFDKECNSLCTTHFLQYIDTYEERHSFCCDRYKKHKKRVKGQRNITVEEAIEYGLIPGQSLCKRCWSDIRKGVPILEEQINNINEYESPEMLIEQEPEPYPSPAPETLRLNQTLGYNFFRFNPIP